MAKRGRPQTKKERFFLNETTGANLRVVDAPQPLLVRPNQEDIDGAIRGDPENCIYARALRRMLGVHHVFIYQETAYVEVLDEEGNHFLNRYKLGTKAQNYVNKFDNGGKMWPSGFYLNPPPPSQLLETMAKKHRALRQRKAKLTKGGKRLSGHARYTGNGGSVTQTAAKRTRKHSTSFRNGIGKVHFNTQSQSLSHGELRK
jgi:hypothetical protein